MLRILFIFVLIVKLISLEAVEPPKLTAKETRLKVEEILKAHVSYQQLNLELIKRALKNYLEELDPLKTYFLDYEIVKWNDPSDEFLKEVLAEYALEKFTVFEKIHQQMLLAIDRRNSLEKQLENSPLPEGVSHLEFKDAPWAKTVDALKERLLRIKSLQLRTATKIDPDIRDQFIQRLTKRRLCRENDLKGQTDQEKQCIVLSYALKSISSALDSQTTYFTPAEANQFMIQLQQCLFGIGAQLRDDLNGLTVVHILEKSPASLPDKLKIGDRIIAVNGEPIIGLEITEAVGLIRGPQGSSVILTVLREIKEGENTKENKLEIELVRGEIVLKESRLETLIEPYGNGVIAILHLFCFYQDNHSSSATDLAKAIEEIKKNHLLKGIILDLRNNAGGLLSEAVSVSSLFLSKGIVVSIKDNRDKVFHLRNLENKKEWDGPLIVLTNRMSASSSEIVAQTLKDYGRAIIIGDPETFGKGTFQTCTLEYNNFGKVNPTGEYKVTRGRYYTASGKSPQLVGVASDIVLPGALSTLEIGEKYSKFPVETDHIEPHFEDNLADIPFIYKQRISKLYQEDKQSVLAIKNLNLLKKNAEERVAHNKNYQNFLKEMAKKDEWGEPTLFFGLNDLQLEETIKVMKDYILLTDKEKVLVAPAA
ncbi:MAG: PDZ domain-containing protein [Chlamydiales bacterium]|jgi:carboxyl-terminal processing protease|nr:PDZ domain-containing protein [Chlamydiales bacterium]